MKKLSEQFLEMSQQTAVWEERVATSQEADRKELETDLAMAKNAVKTAQTSFETRLDSIDESVSSQWRKVQESFNNQVATIRSKAAELKAAHNLADAKDRADYYEAYAEAAADFARLAASEADAAALQAMDARAYADSLERMAA